MAISGKPDSSAGCITSVSVTIYPCGCKTKVLWCKSLRYSDAKANLLRWQPPLAADALNLFGKKCVAKVRLPRPILAHAFNSGSPVHRVQHCIDRGKLGGGIDSGNLESGGCGNCKTL